MTHSLLVVLVLSPKSRNERSGEGPLLAQCGIGGPGSNHTLRNTQWTQCFTKHAATNTNTDANTVGTSDSGDHLHTPTTPVIQ